MPCSDNTQDAATATKAIGDPRAARISGGKFRKGIFSWSGDVLIAFYIYISLGPILAISESCQSVAPARGKVLAHRMTRFVYLRPGHERSLANHSARARGKTSGKSARGLAQSKSWRTIQ
jgi:hypothetical protein